jgi:hypothetical protein
MLLFGKKNAPEKQDAPKEAEIRSIPLCPVHGGPMSEKETTDWGTLCICPKDGCPCKETIPSDKLLSWLSAAKKAAVAEKEERREETGTVF